MSDNNNQREFNPAVLNGVALIVVGGLLLLDQMNVISFDFWALIFGVFGLLRIFQAQDASGRMWGIFLLAIGAAFELEHLHYFHIDLERTWPVFVIAAGLILIWRAYQQPSESGGILSPHLNVFAVLGGGEYRIRAQNFRGGDLVAFMGGFDVDLRDAEIEGNEAVITVNALMGGGVIRVPERWAVSMRVAAFMGGHSLKAREGAQPAKTLIVKGVAIMGGIEVRN
ncbi:MAG: LiaI-LiaF-like domain-containing protein [Terriglobales bacterium]